uniref:PDZ and LIM domain 4 n=1 Tax=Anas zonorhyncha TaxID=75864 RepID=A0A8B9VQQ7_9AVES
PPCWQQEPLPVPWYGGGWIPLALHNELNTFFYPFFFQCISRVAENGIDVESDVYKMLQDYEKPVSEPKQSGSFRYLQGMLEAGENGKEGCWRLPAVPKLGGAMSGMQMLPECTRCGNGIVGTIVKARDKLYHPECFMCDDCGLNLKQRGYFFIEEQLYCETHAKERVKPPEGYDVVAVYPNAKVELV